MSRKKGQQVTETRQNNPPSGMKQGLHEQKALVLLMSSNSDVCIGLSEFFGTSM